MAVVDYEHLFVVVVFVDFWFFYSYLCIILFVLYVMLSRYACRVTFPLWAFIEISVNLSRENWTDSNKMT